MCQTNIQPPKYWRLQNAVVIMAHIKTGFPIIKSLLDLGMNVVGVSSNLKQVEYLKHLLNNEQAHQFSTKEINLHRIIEINKLILDLRTEFMEIKLLMCLMPRIDLHERDHIYEIRNTHILQSILEIDDLSAGAVCSAARRYLMHDDKACHIWTIRFHHDQPDLVHELLQKLLPMGEKAPRFLNVNLIRQSNEAYMWNFLQGRGHKDAICEN